MNLAAVEYIEELEATNTQMALAAKAAFMDMPSGITEMLQEKYIEVLNG